MTAEDRSHVRHGEHTIHFTVLRRDRTTLEIGVEPDARVVVAAPLDAPMEAIVEKVRRRASWIRRQQRFFSRYQPRTPERRFLSGETHLYLGRQYRLRVLFHARPGVDLTRGFITVRSRKPDDPEATRRLVERWYRDRAHAKFAERLEVNLARFPEPESFRPRGLVVRHLRQRWGSVSPSSRLVLNRRLIQAPLDSVDYVITHELCHMTEPHHGPAFFDLLGRVLPDWPKRKERLERTMA